MARSSDPDLSKLPSGSYAQTAQSVHYEGDMLVGQLRKEDGSWVPASVNLGAPTFVNVDGTLVYTESAPPIVARVLGAAPATTPAAATPPIDAATAKSIGNAVAGIGGALTGTTSKSGTSTDANSTTDDTSADDSSFDDSSFDSFDDTEA